MIKPLLVFHFLSLAPSHLYLPSSPSLESGSGQKQPETWDTGGILFFQSLKPGLNLSVVSGSSGCLFNSDDKLAELGLSFWVSIFFFADAPAFWSSSWPSSGPAQEVPCPSYTEAPELDAVLQVAAKESRVERNSFSSQAKAEESFPV